MQISNIDQFFKGDSYTIDWDFALSIPEIKQLSECRQPKKYHGEGDALEHTKMVVTEAEKIASIQLKDDTLEIKRIFMLSALLHDIGKIVTTEFSKDEWHSYGHDVKGEQITRRLLWNLPLYQREQVCKLVRWHMERFGYRKWKDPFKKMVELSNNANIRLLMYLCEADTLGSISDNEDTRSDLINIASMTRLAKAMHCYDKSFSIDGITNEETVGLILNGVNYFNRDDRPTAYVLIGLSGCGKNTYIDEVIKQKEDIKDTVILSRDYIREHLGYCNKGEKIIGTSEQESKVSELFDLKMNASAQQGKDLVFNNLNIKKKYRDAYKQKLKKYNYKWVYVYIEAPSLEDNLERRKGQISEDIFINMIENFDWPKAGEYDYLQIEKQVKK